MKKQTMAARRCYFCPWDHRVDSASNIHTHCRGHHTDIDTLIGRAPSGFTFRRLDEDHPNILVAMKGEGNLRNVMYCLSCQRLKLLNLQIEPSDASSYFSAHRCDDDKRASKRKGKSLGPRKKGTAMTTPAAPKRTAGIWLDGATLVQLRAKYPSIAACYEFDDTRVAPDGTSEYDFMKTLESMCKLLTIGEEQERKMRGTAKKSTSAFTSDPWEAVGRELLHDEAIADGYDQLTNGALEYYKTEVIDWKIAKNKDATKKDLPAPYPDVEMDSDDDMSVDEIELIEPDDNVHRTVIREAVIDSIKRLNRKPKKLSPVADAAPTVPVSVPPGDEAPIAGCKSE